MTARGVASARVIFTLPIKEFKGITRSMDGKAVEWLKSQGPGWSITADRLLNNYKTDIKTRLFINTAFPVCVLKQLYCLSWLLIGCCSGLFFKYALAIIMMRFLT
jgi:hypothetical protein